MTLTDCGDEDDDDVGDLMRVVVAAQEVEEDGCGGDDCKIVVNMDWGLNLTMTMKMMMKMTMMMRLEDFL